MFILACVCSTRAKKEGKAMNGKYSDAIQALLEELEQHTRAALETKKLVNSLRRKNGEEPLFSDAELQESQLVAGVIRADLFYGKPLATAAREYLEIRKRACKPEEIFDGLTEGGFDFDSLGWNEKDRVRSLAMSMAKNTGLFHRLPNGLFGLRAWYSNIVEKRKIERDDQKRQKENGDQTGEDQESKDTSGN
jgi:hypothetical protein